MAEDDVAALTKTRNMLVGLTRDLTVMIERSQRELETLTAKLESRDS